MNRLLNLSNREEDASVSSGESQPVFVPSFSSWFDLLTVSDIEKRQFPEYEGRFDVYKQARNYLVETFRRSPSSFLTLTIARRTLPVVLDVPSLMKIYQFLESWGLINYRVEKTEKPEVPKATEERIFSILPKGIAVPTTLDTTLYPSMSIPTRSCHSCQAALEEPYYHCIKNPNINVCMPCFAQGRFPMALSSGDFAKMEHKEDADWTDQQVLYLLEGIEMYGDDWDQVAKHCFKSREDCVSKFLGLPILEPFVTSSDALPFKTSENPVMSIVSFLASLVHPKIASAAAKAAIETYDAIMHESKETNESFDPMDSSVLQRVSEVILENAGSQAQKLVETEASNVQKALYSTIEGYISQVQSKLTLLNTLEANLQQEILDVKKHTKMVLDEKLALLKQLNDSGTSTVSL